MGRTMCDDSKPFALTGLIFGPDRTVIGQAEHLFRNAAGNFCINDKPTGAVVSRQPFGGSRHSGTNDKAGFWINLVGWVSPRAIEETLVPADYFTYGGVAEWSPQGLCSQ